MQSLGRIGTAVIKDKFIVTSEEWDGRRGERWRLSGESGQISEVKWRKRETNAMLLDEQEGLKGGEGVSRVSLHGRYDAYAISARRGAL